MWTAENRPRYNRDKLRYPSDLTYEEWAHIEPLIPPAKRGGGKRRVDMREVVNGVMYLLSKGLLQNNRVISLPSSCPALNRVSTWQTPEPAAPWQAGSSPAMTLKGKRRFGSTAIGKTFGFLKLASTCSDSVIPLSVCPETL